MRKTVALNLGTLVALAVVFYFAYHVLLCDHSLNLSISEIIALSHQQSVTTHLVILGLIPIYIAIVIFGAATLSIYLGGLLQQGICRLLRPSSVNAR